MAGSTGPSADGLQFDTAEPGLLSRPDQRTPTCAACGRAITSNYFTFGNAVVCPDCVAATYGQPQGNPLSRFVLAAAYGFGAAAAGAVVWYLVRTLLHLNIGLVAVLVGYMVGKSVRRGSGNRGGVGYQLLAAGLTCVGVILAYVPDTIRIVLNQSHAHSLAVKVFDVVVLSAMAPYYWSRSPITLVIYGFAVWEAWKLAQAVRVPLAQPASVPGFPVLPVTPTASGATPPVIRPANEDVV